jgi:hypothetical protein
MRRLMAILASALCLSATATSAQTPPQSRIARVEALKAPVIDGRIRTYYSAGREIRARELQALMTAQKDYYRDALGVEVDLALAVFDPKDWAAAEPRLPFGIPSVSASPHVALMPARWADSKLGFFPQATTAPPELTARVRAAGLDWTRTLELGADGIIGHEFGHTLVGAYGIRAPNHWVNELLATYAGYAFMKAKRPDQAFAFDVFNGLGLKAAHRHSSLPDYHAKYMEILTTDPGSVQWYQAQFLERVKAVHAVQGVDFLRRAKAAFPVGQPKLSEAEVMARLEALHPGWTEWAEAMEATPTST